MCHCQHILKFINFNEVQLLFRKKRKKNKRYWIKIVYYLMVLTKSHFRIEHDQFEYGYIKII